MSLLYSNIPPLKLNEGQITLSEKIKESMRQSDSVYIATGYASKKSLIELNSLVQEYNIKKIILVLGMYCIEGFPESIYNTAISIHEEWMEKQIGEIRITPSIKYHGKVYSFYRDGTVFNAMIGSHNLGALVLDANNRRQYELSINITDKATLDEVDSHLQQLIKTPASISISDVPDITIIHEENEKLRGVEGVVKISKDEVTSFKDALQNIEFTIPLKVPGIPGAREDYMKSNINKCYAKGRENKRTKVITERGWWETEVIVSKKITNSPNYPEKGKPFYVITDDGWKFKAHVAGDGKKNFESHDDLKILGYWLKGRLVAAGFVEPVDSPAKDLANICEDSLNANKKCKGVITYKMLEKYGRTELTFAKTTKTMSDEDDANLDVWVLSFLPNNVK